MSEKQKDLEGAKTEYEATCASKKATEAIRDEMEGTMKLLRTEKEALALELEDQKRRKDENEKNLLEEDRKRKTNLDNMKAFDLKYQQTMLHQDELESNRKE